MAQKGKITQRLIEKITESYPEDPKYKEGKYKDLTEVEDRANQWYRDIVNQFSKFEHNPHSNIYKHGHDRSETKTISLRDDLKAGLLKACKYRCNNFKSKLKSGWKVFDKITGIYDVSIQSEKTIMKRLEMLGLFVDHLNAYDYLKQHDPATGKVAITSIDPKTTKMIGIEYAFPFGIDRTDKLHYTILEKEIVINVSESKKALNKYLREVLINDKKPKAFIEKVAVGRVMANFESLRKSFEEVRKIVIPIIANINDEFKEGGVDSVIATLETLKGGDEDKLTTEGSLREVSKTIGVPELLARVKDEDVKTYLRAIKPPTEKTKAGTRWPKEKGGHYIIHITQEPLHLLTKSTGRAWSTTSCEDYYGSYRQGAYSDIMYGNAIAWIYHAKDVKTKLNEQGEITDVEIERLYNYEANGRILLRWGNAILNGEKSGHDIGIEWDTYYTTQDGSPAKKAPWGVNMVKSLAMILKDNGLYTYEKGGDVCKTPYVYHGYSDKSGSKTQITYDELGLKGAGGRQNFEIEDEEAMFVRMASDVKISYNTVGILLEEGGSAILRALAQNPVIWNMPRSIRRFMEELRFIDDIDERKTILRLLIGNDLAKIDIQQSGFAFTNVAENIEFYEPQNQSWVDFNRDNSVVRDLLNHPNTTTEIHLTMLENHKGFKLGSRNLGGIAELCYMGLIGEHNLRGQGLKSKTGQRFISNAPTEVLDKIVSVVSKGPDKAKYFKRTKKNMPLVLLRIIEDLRIAGVNSNDENKDRFLAGVETPDLQYYMDGEYLKAIRNLIFAPNLTEKSYLMLLRSFRDYMWTRFGKGITDIEDLWAVEQSGSASSEMSYSPRYKKLLKATLADIQMSICVPLQQPSDYGFREKFMGCYIGLQNIHDNIRGSPFERQSVDAIKLVLDAGGIEMIASYGFDVNGESKPPVYPRCALWENIRSREVFDWIYQGTGVITKKILDLSLSSGKNPQPPFKHFLYKSRSRKNPKEPNHRMFISETKFLETLKRIPLDELTGILTFDFLPYDMKLHQERDVVPPKAINYLLKNPNIMHLIGWDVVGAWLIDPKHFMAFESIVLSQALQRLYQKGIRKAKLVKLPTKITERYIVLSQNTDKIYVLNHAARGLGKNPHIPSSLQMRLMLPAESETYGMKWALISRAYEGDYDEIQNLVVKELAMNEGLSMVAWKYLFINRPELRGELLSNARLSEVIESGFDYEPYIHDNYLDLLNNKGLMPIQNKTITNEMIRVLSINPESNINRMWQLANNQYILEGLLNADTSMKNRNDYFSYLVKEHPWTEFWRGGKYKGKMNLPIEHSMFKNKEGKPEAIADEPTIITDRPHIVFKFDITEMKKMKREAYEDDDGEEAIREKEIKVHKVIAAEQIYVEKIKKLRKYYQIDGKIRKTNFDERYVGEWEDYSERVDIYDFYGFIPFKDRSEEITNFKGDPAKWTSGLTVVLQDEDLHEEDKDIPIWRSTWDIDNMQKLLELIIKNNNTDDALLISLLKHPKFMKESPIESPARSGNRAKFSKSMLFNMIDEENRWTPKIINSSIDDLLNPDSNYYITRYRNVMPTEKIINLTLLENDASIQKQYKHLNLNYIQQIQYWIVNGFGYTPNEPERQIDISYIYLMVDWPYASNQTRQRAIAIRDNRLAEFLIYQDRYGGDEEVMDAESYKGWNPILNIVKRW